MHAFVRHYKGSSKLAGVATLLATVTLTSGLGVSDASAVIRVDPAARTFVVPDGNGGVRTVGPNGRASGASAATATWQYQTDLVAPSDITDADGVVTRVEMNVRTGTRGCADVESCAGGVRKTSGYTWFHPLTVEVGATASENVAGLHAGVALGGSGQSAQWYFDWSGYWGPDSTHVDGSPVGASLGHGILLSEATWYRIRIARAVCAGGIWGYKAKIRALSSSTWQNAGKFCIGAADRIAEVYYFTEIIEHDVCTTDFLYGEAADLSYYVHRTKHAFAHATGWYESTCVNTNLRITTGTGTIDVRGVTRGNNGGITQSGQQLW